jgi:membrane protein
MIKPLIHITIKSITSFFYGNYLYRASALTFTTILAIVPLFTLIIFFMSFFPVFSNLVFLSESYLLENFAPSSSDIVRQNFSSFVNQATAMPTSSILFLFITAIMLINTIEETLNFIWQSNNHRKKIYSLVFYWLIILLTPLIIGSSIFVSSVFFNTVWMLKITEIFKLKLFIDFILPIIINTILFTLLYNLVPCAKTIWKCGLLGGFITALLLNITRIGFIFYINHFQSYSIIYGVFSAIPIFMLWLYIAWIIIIWGALFTYHLQNVCKKKSS